MPIDNDVYNRHAARWWDEDEPLNMLHGSVTPARFGYFAAVCRDSDATHPGSALWTSAAGVASSRKSSPGWDVRW